MSMINIKETRWKNIKDLEFNTTSGGKIKLGEVSIDRLNALNLVDKANIIKALLDYCIDSPKGTISINRKLSNFSYTNGPDGITHFISFGPWAHVGKAESTIHIQGNIIYEDDSEESMSDKTIYWKYEDENNWYKWTDTRPILNKKIRFGVEFNNFFSLPHSLSSNALIKYISNVSDYTISGDDNNRITTVDFLPQTIEGFQAFIQGNITMVTTSKEGKIYFKQEESSSTNVREFNIQSHVASVSGSWSLPFNYVAVTGDSHYSYLWDDGNRLIDMIENQSSYIQNSISFVKESEEVKSNFTENLTSNSNVIIYKEFLNKIASNYKIPNYRINGDDRHKIIRFNDNQNTLDKTKEEGLKGQFLDGEAGKNNDFNAKYWGAMPQIYPEIVYNDWESINANSNDIQLQWSGLNEKQRILTIKDKMYIINKQDVVVMLQRSSTETINYTIPEKDSRNWFWHPNINNGYIHKIVDLESSCDGKNELIISQLQWGVDFNQPLTQVRYFSLYPTLSSDSILIKSLLQWKEEKVDMYLKNVSDHTYTGKFYNRGFSIGEYDKWEASGWKKHCNLHLSCKVKYPVLITPSNKSTGCYINYGSYEAKQTTDSGDVHCYLNEDFIGYIYAFFSSYPGVFPSIIGFLDYCNCSFPDPNSNFTLEYSVTKNGNIPTYKSRWVASDNRTSSGIELGMYFQNKASQNGYVVVIWRNGQLVLDAEKNQTK